MNRFSVFVAAAAALLAPVSALAQAKATDEELANKLSNPVSDLISVPFQGNYDCCFGPDDGGRYTLNIQPVVPLKLSPDWNLIVRTILPVIYQERTSPSSGVAQGLGDTTQSFFFSPTKPVGGMIIGFGPAFLWPTGESELGTKKWGAGPTILALKQEHGVTFGVLANHIWSYADLGSNDRPNVSTTFVQPFLSWTSPKATTLALNTEASYDWKAKEWSIPVNMQISHVYRIGEQRISIGGGPRVYAARAGTSGPDYGFRLFATFLFPE